MEPVSGKLPTKTEMHAAREQGWSDAVAIRGRAPEHESYLGKDLHAATITRAYNGGFIAGTQQALQDRYGDLP